MEPKRAVSLRPRPSSRLVGLHPVGRLWLAGQGPPSLGRQPHSTCWDRRGPSSSVEADRPFLHRLDDQMALAPRVLAERGPNSLLAGGFDDKDNPAVTVERPPQDDKAGFDQSVHEAGVGIPAQLLFQGFRPVPQWAGPEEDDQVHGGIIGRRCGNTRRTTVVLPGAGRDIDQLLPGGRCRRKRKVQANDRYH